MVRPFGRNSEPQRVTYANPNAQMSYEVAASVRRLDRELPADEGAEIRLSPISFSPDHEKKGHAVLFFAGDFMLTDESEEVYYIQPRTLRMLDKLKVSYQVVTPASV